MTKRDLAEKGHHLTCVAAHSDQTDAGTLAIKYTESALVSLLIHAKALHRYVGNDANVINRGHAYDASRAAYKQDAGVWERWLGTSLPNI
jgi:hypothetical protein